MTSAPINSKYSRALSGVAFAALLLTTACSGDAGNSAAENAANPISNVSTEAPPTVEPNANGAATAAATGLLSKYIGKHPSEAVGGARFLDEPTVRAAVAQTVADPKVRDFVFNYNGPDAPIVAKDSRILAWGCERHNCGYHNWSIAITPDGTAADVCFYHNDESADGPATWYLPDGRMEKREGNCPSD